MYANGTPWARRALEGIDLDLRRGEGIVVTGDNGSGKSTLAWILAGLLVPTEGEVLLEGQPVVAGTGAVGISFQHARLQLIRPTVLSDVAYGADKERATAALRSVGLDPVTMGPRRVDELSGGEQRRVALAGLLVRDPVLLVLDEPYAGLDDEARAGLADDSRPAARRARTWPRWSSRTTSTTRTCWVTGWSRSRPGAWRASRALGAGRDAERASGGQQGFSRPRARTRAGAPATCTSARSTSCGSCRGRARSTACGRGPSSSLSGCSRSPCFSGRRGSRSGSWARWCSSRSWRHVCRGGSARGSRGGWAVSLRPAPSSPSSLGGQPDVHLGSLRVGLGGLGNFMRFSMVGVDVLASAALLGWTTPLADLSPALGRLLGPLRHLRVPVDELVGAIALSIRCLPLLLEEARVLRAARRARRPANPRSFRELGDESVEVVFGALANAIRRAREIAEAIEARGGVPTVAPETHPFVGIDVAGVGDKCHGCLRDGRPPLRAPDGCTSSGPAVLGPAPDGRPVPAGRRARFEGEWRTTQEPGRRLLS